ncbi:MAG: hypothetical protein P9M15_01700 [Candidatus Electryoneaceae bacterium]|nr:hypothetical protein [Candidatus Electryoneaceae bacterium]
MSQETLDGLKKSISDLLEVYQTIPPEETELRKDTLETIKANTQLLKEKQALAAETAERINADLDSMLAAIILSKTRIDEASIALEKGKLDAIKNYLKG